MKRLSDKLSLLPDDVILTVNADNTILDILKTELCGGVMFLKAEDRNPKSTATYERILVWIDDVGKEANRLPNFGGMMDSTSMIWLFFRKAGMRNPHSAGDREKVRAKMARRHYLFLSEVNVDTRYRALGFSKLY